MNMEVPLLDLKAQYATIKEQVLAAVSEVLESQRCIGGPKVAELEEKIAAISDSRFAVGVSSGAWILAPVTRLSPRRLRFFLQWVALPAPVQSRYS
jgi:dTDP-4-amino-4,6-dideoxygalactose transaminase